jgi:hypothetical protein
VKTADAVLRMFAMDMACWLCLISDIEVHLNGSMMTSQIQRLIGGGFDERQLLHGTVLCIKRDQNFLNQNDRRDRPRIMGEMSYAFAMFAPDRPRAKTLQGLFNDCMTSSSTTLEMNSAQWTSLFSKIFEVEHCRLPPLMALVPAWINNPHIFTRMLSSFVELRGHTSGWQDHLASEYRKSFGVIHFAHGFNLKTVRTVQEQYQMLEAPFVHYCRRWQIQDVVLKHETLISTLFMRLQIGIAEEIFKARQVLQGEVWFASYQSEPAAVAIARHIWEVCETDKEMWRIKLDWNQSERGCWVDEVRDPHMHWATPAFAVAVPQEVSSAELPRSSVG